MYIIYEMNQSINFIRINFVAYKYTYDAIVSETRTYVCVYISAERNSDNVKFSHSCMYICKYTTLQVVIHAMATIWNVVYVPYAIVHRVRKKIKAAVLSMRRVYMYYMNWLAGWLAGWLACNSNVCSRIM